jgi:hypothetical protein
METLDALLGLALGVGLAAACGFRIFVPLLVAGIATKTGNLDLAGGFEWMGSNVAIATFAVATVLEIVAYWVPWLDNALDTIAGPTALAAGTLVAASTLGEMSPLLRWTLAAIAGGGATAFVQTATTVARQVSSATTGGLANPILSTAEAGGAAVLSVVSVLAPVVGLFFLALLVVLVVRLVRGRRPNDVLAATP